MPDLNKDPIVPDTDSDVEVDTETSDAADSEFKRLIKRLKENEEAIKATVIGTKP